jgi:exopolysaccharide production protein ExoZ
MTINQTSRVASYDLMRGVAILGVILAHASEYVSTGNARVDLVESYGRFGVQLFFYISALTMCMMWERRSDERHQIYNFYVRRFFRIAPLFWLAIPVYYTGSMTAGQISLTAVFLHGFAPDTINAVVPGGWTIAVEMTFYAIFPLIITRVKNNPNFYMALALAAYLANALIFSPLFSGFYGPTFANQPEAMKDFLYMNFFHQLPVFLAGCSIYFSGKKAPSRCVVALIAVWLAISATRCFLGFDSSMEHMTLLTLLMFPAVFYVCHCAFNSRAAALLEQLGSNSYALYLSHFFVLSAVARLAALTGARGSGYLLNFAAFAATVAGSFFLARILHYAIERPTHKLVARLVSPEPVFFLAPRALD